MENGRICITTLFSSLAGCFAGGICNVIQGMDLVYPQTKSGISADFPHQPRLLTTDN